MVIEVTQEHIDKGLKMSCSMCPVALALKDKGFTHVSVIGYSMFVDGSRYINTPELRQFINDFDMGEYVKPVQFEVH